MSFVYHGNYVKYFEIGRIAWLKKLGISYKQMENDGMLLPVIDVKVNFRKPALFDDKLVLLTKLKQIPSYMIEFEYTGLIARCEISFFIKHRKIR